MKVKIRLDHTIRRNIGYFEYIKPMVETEFNIPDKLIENLDAGNDLSLESNKKINKIYKKHEQLTGQLFKQIVKKNEELCEEREEEIKEKQEEEIDKINFNDIK